MTPDGAEHLKSTGAALSTVTIHTSPAPARMRRFASWPLLHTRTARSSAIRNWTLKMHLPIGLASWNPEKARGCRPAPGLPVGTQLPPDSVPLRLPRSRNRMHLHILGVRFNLNEESASSIQSVKYRKPQPSRDSSQPALEFQRIGQGESPGRHQSAAICAVDASNCDHVIEQVVAE